MNSFSSKQQYYWNISDVVTIQSHTEYRSSFFLKKTALQAASSEDRSSELLFLYLHKQIPKSPALQLWGTQQCPEQHIPTCVLHVEEQKHVHRFKTELLSLPDFRALEIMFQVRQTQVHSACRAGSAEKEVSPLVALAQWAMDHRKAAPVELMPWLWWKGRSRENECSTVESGIWLSD